MEFSITPIGIIQTPFDNLKGMPIQPSGAAKVMGTIVMEKEYEQGLNDLDGFSHIILLYHFHESKGYNLMVKPFLDDHKRGLFSTRAPRRPNPIGLSIVRLIKREGNRLTIKGIDVLNGTPLIDIKPYVPGFDTKEVTSIGWLEKSYEKAVSIKSDDRFI
ncbi:MAG: tRNA (N6-threonylcarbamoyladenosine(37)-N6)-methyltransferase TrmO [Desulfobacula sp.]|jgi:tRNA (adenine37-N6)-methyltransferase|uniref:tRNA (N6-threonylcarbamoyladenosine(37)-N6)-methyltransferase TrmO n=1 Tax=Desulfobacula sp. TaxID=2593537 RepID=UPI001DB2E85F|nr:tRNA (N6-threonylcarbamoyladenosine(37)-N6)-methyltransferase TrmO [Desulfobacula sp.]MBT3803815.1 tRNA (N6-threonylcarbamoyladenosine(37)-N6)-methyltransferase TrmO [Desulfobacula sp.]MBT4023760.1 tRNA (N6-threonylcarbamoyladenosine(37)-N6)-methyltransferase TrmO [Desulfobacula sp.]MBT4505236.1 tRNA (N6-threonylcarbamoyladenosine(37)-N6)-methyltransferase TrmO [Desulfobacula sp.]MBT4874804.1 tRNA (N6-threonylcarbamoyladenosine(37)-N6)-methyltransferase TrmO [Desulfobacula sp.]